MKQNVHVKFHSKAILEELEARQLFSGGIEGVLADDNEPEAAVHMELNPEPEQTNSDSTAPSTADSLHQELVFIDTDVENYQELLNDILAQSDDGRNIEVILLDNERDGIDQITETLANYQNLDAVHLISHGSDGNVDIGNSFLNAETLNQSLAQISAWSNAFSKDGDFLIYGCNLAATEDGQSLVQSLSSLTQTDVAASDDLTGQAELGGDWDLEYTTGIIEADIAIDETAQSDYQGVLAIAVDNITTKTDDTAATNITFSHATSGNDRLMLVSLSMHDDRGDASSVTYGGDSLTLLGRQQNGQAQIELWALVAPNTGTNDVVVDLVGGNHGVVVGVTTFTDVDQANPYGSFYGNNGNINTISITGITSAAGDKVFAVVDHHRGTSLTPDTGESEQWDLYLDNANGGGYLKDGALTVDMSWTPSISEKWAVGAISIHSAPNNNAPVISIGTGDSAAATLTESNAGLSVADTLTQIDVDTTNTVSSTVVSVVESGNVSGIANASLLAMMGVTGGLTNTETGGTLNWSFDSGTQAFDYLASGESLLLTYTIKVTDSIGATDTQAVVISINSSNDAPVATNLSAAETYTEDTALNLIDIVASDVDSASLTVTLTLSDLAAGSLSTATSSAVTSTFAAGVWTASGATADVNTLLAAVTFSPSLNYNSNFSIATRVSDGTAPDVTGNKVMTATAVNDTPTVANLIPNITVLEDAIPIRIDISSVFADMDINSGSLTYSAVSSNGSLVTVAISGTTLTLTYAADQNGSATITVTATDGSLTVTNSFSITVTAINDTPVILDVSPTIPIAETPDLISDTNTEKIKPTNNQDTKSELDSNNNTSEIRATLPIAAPISLDPNANNQSTSDDEFFDDYKNKTSNNAPSVKQKSVIDQWTESQFHTSEDFDLQLEKTPSTFELGDGNRNNDLWNSVDLMRNQMDADKDRLDKNDIEFVAGGTVSLTAGVVSWVLRGGTLLSSLLSSVSLFKQFDPLAVVFNVPEKDEKNKKTDGKDEHDKKVEAMFDKKNE